jgi:hypothetical protein
MEGNKNYMTVPSDVVKKLQAGNDNFIVAYNPHKIAQNTTSNVPDIKLGQV